jgi:hypothetical protein
MDDNHALGSMLARWHQWRSHYSHERGLSRIQFDNSGREPEDEYEQLLMKSIETEILKLPRDEQLALQHIARAECLGVEVFFNMRMMQDRVLREILTTRAMANLQRRLLHLGFI